MRVINALTLAPDCVDLIPIHYVYRQLQRAQQVAIFHAHAVPPSYASLRSIKQRATRDSTDRIYVLNHFLAPCVIFFSHKNKCLIRIVFVKNSQNIQLHLSSQQSIFLVDQCKPLCH